MKQDVGQYWAHAIKDLEAYPFVNENIEKGRRLIIESLKTAVKINLPLNGEIYRSAQVQPTEDEIDSVILPAPITAYQYEWDLEPEDDKDKAPRRITLMLDFTEDQEMVVLWSIYYVEAFKRWTFAHTMLYLQLPITMDGMRGSIRNMLTDEYLTGDTPEVKQMLLEFSTDLSIFIQFCHAVRAGAEISEKRETSFGKMQRLKKARVPNDTYHVLNLPNTSSSASGGGAHASPRLHFRRAHIRKLSSGDLTWVRSCLVGDSEKGIIRKDYKVEK